MGDLAKPTGDFVTSTLSGALAAGATTATIASGLSLPATNGILHINYDSSVAVGTDEGPETIQYATYTTGTGALAGITRGLGGTTDVAHANGSTVSAGISVEHLNEYDRKNVSNQTIIGNNDYRAVRFVPKATAGQVINSASGNPTAYQDLDLTAETSATTFAVTFRVLIKGASANNVATFANKDGTIVGIIAQSWSTTVFAPTHGVVGCDSGQLIQWKTTSATDAITANVTGYWEYVD